MADSKQPSSAELTTGAASPSPLDSRPSDRMHYLSQLSVPTDQKYLQAGYSSADPSEYQSETPEEDTAEYQQTIARGHQESSAPTSPHGIQHRRFSWRHLEHSRPFVQDSKWKLYDPHPLLSNLVHHGNHTPVQGDLEKSSEQEKPKHRHHHYHYHPDSKQSQSDEILQSAGSGVDRPSIRTPTYDKSHYTFSAAGNNTRLLLEQDSKSTTASSNEKSLTQAPDHFPGPDDETDTESDSSPPGPVFLGHRSSTNYQTELTARRAESRKNSDESAENPVAATITSSVKELENRVSNMKIDDSRGHVVGVRPYTFGHHYRMVSPSSYKKAHTFYDAEPTPGSQSLAPNKLDEEGPQYESQSVRSPHGNTTSNNDAISFEVEDDLLRRKSADGEFQSFEATTGSVKAEMGDEGSWSPTLLFQARQRSFDYNDYKSHFHGLLMTPEEEKKPGFSSNE
ncbi:uncharacterized protein V1513DRAFT_436604 [Lipomyces chichibuensis]|uniref:uncharacterized protein n=1 Tax=Lipomyces chichibuensis TaxID=1546026 RepID=UPI0033439585